MDSQYRILLFSKREEDVAAFREVIPDTMQKMKLVCYDYIHFTDPVPLSRHVLMNKNQYDLYFIDYNDSNARDLLKQFWNADITAPIVLITGSAINSSCAYCINLLDYLFRPISPRVLQRLLLHNYCRNVLDNRIMLRKNSNYFFINASNIVFVEVYNRGVRIHLTDLSELSKLSLQPDLSEDMDLSEQTIFYSEKISSFTKKLSPLVFVQCHQSFIINILKVVSLRRYTAILDGKSESPVNVDVSKRHYDNVKKSLIWKNTHYRESKPLSESELTYVAGGVSREFYLKLFE